VLLDDGPLALEKMAVLAFDLSLGQAAYIGMVLLVVMLSLGLRNDLPALLASVVVPRTRRLVDPVLTLLDLFAADTAGLGGLRIGCFHSLRLVNSIAAT